MHDSSDLQFARFFRTHYPALVLYARQWTAEAPDVVQEAFVKLAAEVPAPQRPVAWLYRVVRNRALNARRGEIRRDRHCQHWAMMQTDTHSIADQDSLLALRQALDGLAEEQREVVVARTWGGLSFQEIAELTGRSLPTCHRHYHQALQQMKTQLAPNLPLKGQG